jgi:hypothetical protein
MNMATLSHSSHAQQGELPMRRRYKASRDVMDVAVGARRLHERDARVLERRGLDREHARDAVGQVCGVLLDDVVDLRDELLEVEACTRQLQLVAWCSGKKVAIADAQRVATFNGEKISPEHALQIHSVRCMCWLGSTPEHSVRTVDSLTAQVLHALAGQRVFLRALLLLPLHQPLSDFDTLYTFDQSFEECTCPSNGQLPN